MSSCSIATRRARERQFRRRLGPAQAAAAARATQEACPGVVKRGRTAIKRSTLSASMAALKQLGWLDGRPSPVRPRLRSVLDYGSGRGDDARALRRLGVPVQVWDPFYAPSERPRPADVVNMAYVLNVIEAPCERLAALEDAWRLTRRVLAIAVQTGSGRATRTSAGTFQHRFTHEQIRSLIVRATGVEPERVRLGVYLVERSPR